MKAAVITISDRSARGDRADESGPLIRDMMLAKGWQVEDPIVIWDDQPGIESLLRELCDGGGIDVILTTGGTGLAARDRAPEATLAVCDRLAPGIAEAMRAASLLLTPHAMLSRAQAGLRGRTLIVNLPGSPKAAKENLAVVLPALPHAVQLLTDAPEAEVGHRPPRRRPQA
jgi:molybdopterin adenylyltransferase